MDHLMLSFSHGVFAAADPTLWYLTRTAAVGAYVTLIVTVILGMLRTIARRSGEQLTWLVDEFHAFFAAITGILILAHLVTLYLDPFLPFALKDLLLPLPDQPYKPLAVNLGVCALYCMIALLLSSWARRRLAYGFWRNVHNLSFVALALVTLHGLLAGSDVDEPWMRALYGIVGGGIGFLILWRLLATIKKPISAGRVGENAGAFDDAFDESF
jgi:methionine sulfoxide reductase heme-binding subunit